MVSHVDRYLLVSSGGGHLKQLYEFAERLEIPVASQDWVTFDTGLSRTLLRGRRRIFAPYAAPRDVINIAKNFLLAIRVLRSTRYSAVISTGASLAVCFLPFARALGVRSIYIESAARASGPSLTGRILALIPGIETYNQYKGWSNDRWRYVGSIFDRYTRGEDRETEVAKAVVSVGTTESYEFRRLFDRLAPLLAHMDVVWQTGVTDVRGLGIHGVPDIDASELNALIADADLIVSHAGTGAALTAFQHGKLPLLVPRRQSHGEHIDDHQEQIANDLLSRRLCITTEADRITPQDLQAAANGTVRETQPPPLRIEF